MSWCKCRYQLDSCENWTEDDLTFGTAHAWMGPPGPDGRSTLVELDEPICRACLATNPEPRDPGAYYGNPIDNPEAVPIPVPRMWLCRTCQTPCSVDSPFCSDACFAAGD